MTPKSLLRHPKARSRIGELSHGSFHRVIQDSDLAGRASAVNRVVLCSGKVYYDLMAAAPRRSDIAVLRLELLYPFPEQALRTALAPYPEDAEICWVQEEPENMGAWSAIRWALEEVSGRRPLYIGRSERASPAEGFAGKHARRQRALVDAALRLG